MDFITGMDTPNNKQGIIVPNPVQNILRIITKIEDLEIQIIDLSGKRLFTGNVKTIDISHLSDGIYIILIRSEKDQLSLRKKIVKY